MTTPTDAAVVAHEHEARLLTTSAAAHERLPAQPHRAKPTGSTIAGRMQKTRWSDREAKRAKQDALRQREREMKQAREDAATQKREARLERKRKQEERARLDAMAQKMSAKKLDRKRRRLGLTKKVKH